MNGSSNDYTVSKKQVERMEEHIDGVISKTKAQLESETNDFFKKLAKNWADDNAVRFALKTKKIMIDTIDDLAKRANSLKSKICDIHNNYAQISGKPTLNPTILNFNAAINESIVKNTFDGDRYGFTDSKSAGLVFTDFTNLINKCNGYKYELKSGIASINAFGHVNVKRVIEAGADALMFKLEEDIRRLINLADTTVREVIRKYDSISSNTGLANSLYNFANSLDRSSLGSTTAVADALTAGFGIAASGTDLLTANDTHVIEGRFGGSNISSDLHAGGSNSTRDLTGEFGIDDDNASFFRRTKSGSIGSLGTDDSSYVDEYYDKMVNFFGKGKKDAPKSKTAFAEDGTLVSEGKIGDAYISKTFFSYGPDDESGNLSSIDADTYKDWSQMKAHNINDGGTNSTTALAAGSSYEGTDKNFFHTSDDSIFSGKLSSIDTSNDFSVYGNEHQNGTGDVINKVIEAYSDGSTPTNVHYDYHRNFNTDEVYGKTTYFDIGDKSFSKTTYYGTDGNDDWTIFDVKNKEN